ncbi:MAG: DinB family protein [Pseudomonadota bacterium]|nr:DinB family protein [Pseudomonadota bacterium]
MDTGEHIVRMAAYNAMMNQNMYAAAAQLSASALYDDRGAFFGSVFGTLNHLAAADTIWLTRFSRHPAHQPALDGMRLAAPLSTLTAPLAADLAGLLAVRYSLDRTIVEWAAALTPAHLGTTLEYANMKGVVAHKNYASLILHFFNHQTHHRGQASTLLAQSGIDIGVTDLLLLISNEV